MTRRQRQRWRGLPGLLLVVMVIAATTAAMATPTARAAEIVLLADGDLSGWEYQSFDDIKQTTYDAAPDAGLQRRVLIANSERGASGWIRKQDIDVQATPWLHFLWRVDTVGENREEQTRAGDDFVWRLYFLTKNFINYRTLNFVYSQSSPAGETWTSPYARMISDIRVHALACHDTAQIGNWRISSVNVADAWRDAFQRDDDIKLVGLMTDGDSVGTTMRAAYGGIVLSDSPASPSWMTAAVVSDDAVCEVK